MTKIEVLKKVLEKNLNELNKSLNLELLIEFRDDKFYIVNKNNKIIYEASLSKIDLDFFSQKRLILDISNKVVKRIDFFKEIKCDIMGGYINNLIQINNKNYIDVLGEGIAYRSNFIRISLKDYNGELSEIAKKRRDFVIENIKNSLDGNKIRVVYSEEEFRDGFYVNKVIKEGKIKIFFTEDLNTIKFNEIFLYYSLTTEEELKEAIDFITWQIARFNPSQTKLNKNNEEHSLKEVKKSSIALILDKIKKFINMQRFYKNKEK